MGLKKKNKVSAEFSMSSLTDIIFLLLIFFMLTSTLVAPNSLNLKLPGNSQKKVTSTRNLDEVRIDERGRYYMNDRSITLNEIDSQLKRLARGKEPQSQSFIIAPDKKAKVEAVVAIMDIALRYEVNGVLAPEK